MKHEPTSAQRAITFSIFSAATYSPCASLKMFFLRSMIERVPSAFHRPMSPVCSQPSASSTLSVSSLFLW